MKCTEIKLYEKLEEAGIAYSKVEHQPIMTMDEGTAIANRLGVRASKNLFLQNRQGEYFLLLMVGDKKLNAKDVAKQIDSSHLSFASTEKLLELLSVEQGAVSILALMFDSDSKVRLLIDEDIVKQDYIGCHPCVNTCSLRLLTKDVLDKFLPAIGHKEYDIIKIA